MANIVVLCALGALLLYGVVASCLATRHRLRDQQRILDEHGPGELARIAERQRFHDKYGY